MSETPTKKSRGPQFSCEMDKATKDASKRIKKNFGINKKVQLQRGLWLLENSLTDTKGTTK
jgi:hypothetical protein